jgi:putative tryptophan/tyrosine transport system substrate-binding protein
MRRREFIAGLSGAMAAWPLAARAQQATKPLIGLLDAASFTSSVSIAKAVALRQGLKETGYAEGRNLGIEYRAADGQYDRLPALATDLVRRRVDAIFADGIPATRAAQAATNTIPIVFIVGGDPIKEGLVTRLNRPEGNLTGVTAFFGELAAKRLQLLRQLVPTATIIGVLVNPTNPNVEFRLQDLNDAARLIGQQIQVVNAGSEKDFDAIFASLVHRGAGALLIGDDPLFELRIEQLVALAARHAVPACYPERYEAAAGGLMSYGPRFTDAYRQVGIYVGRILQGTKPADLPVVQPTKFELVINIKTAKALCLTIPETLLATADEVIQ